MVKIYACKLAQCDYVISSLEAQDVDMSTRGLHLASVEVLQTLVNTQGGASAYGGPIQCKDGNFVFDFDSMQYHAI